MDIIAEKKGEDILLLDLEEITPLADYFIICNGNSERQLRALVASVREEIKKAHQLLPLQIEGEASSGWILMDYGTIIVHIFTPELRIFYDLENLWEEGRTVVRIQ